MATQEALLSPECAAEADQSARLVAVVHPYSQALNFWKALRDYEFLPVPVVPGSPEAFGMSPTELSAGLRSGWAPSIDHPTDPNISFDQDAHNVAQLIREYEAKNGATTAALVPGDDSAVPLTERVADLLGITPRQDWRTSADRTDKEAMQAALARHNVPHPRTFKVEKLGDAIKALRLLGGECFFKPDNSASSVGAGACRDKEELTRAWTARVGKTGGLGKPIKKIVLQELLKGEKLTVDMVSVTVDGVTYHVETETWREHVIYKDGGVAWRSSVYSPGHMTPEIAKAIEYTGLVLDATGVITGPSNTELKRTKKGPRLIKIGARFPGIYPLDLVEEATGSSQLTYAAEAIADPAGFIERSAERSRRIGAIAAGMEVRQEWLVVPRSAKLDLRILEHIGKLPTLRSCSPGFIDDELANKIFEPTRATPDSPGYFNFLGTRQQVRAAVRELRWLERKSLYRYVDAA